MSVCQLVFVAHESPTAASKLRALLLTMGLVIGLGFVVLFTHEQLFQILVIVLKCMSVFFSWIFLLAAVQAQKKPSLSTVYFIFCMFILFIFASNISLIADISSKCLGNILRFDVGPLKGNVLNVAAVYSK